MAIAAVAIHAAAFGAAAEHPFILWTKDEAAAIRKRVESEPWAKAAVERMRAGGERGRRGDAGLIEGLFLYSVMGDKAAGEAEKKALLGTGGKSREYVDALRYDVLYDLLSEAERAAVEDNFRKGILGGIASQAGHGRNRHNWLPNLQYVWFAGRQIQAVALRDKELVRKAFESDFGWRWYIGTYLSDTGLYGEEFGKSNWAPPVLLLYGRGCKRLGVNELGFGYRGNPSTSSGLAGPSTGSGQGNQASARGMIEAYLDIAYPRADLGTGCDHWPTVSMGDAKNQARRPLSGYPWQQCNIVGRLVDGVEPPERSFGGMLDTRYWFEMAHAEWPDAGFDFFLAQMRGPKEDKYYPTPFFGLEPIEAAKVKPPPAPSRVFTQRGLAMLRADESPAYWTGPAPAVAMRMSAPYAHHVEDSFSLCGFYAFNRPIYVNHVNSTNYTGVDPGWSNSMRSHAGVIVDGAEPRSVGELPSRHDFSGPAKFFACRGRGIFEGVDQTRALMLTKEYLLDVSALASDRPRQYLWQAHTFGRACADEPDRWAATRDLAALVPDLGNEQSLATSGLWGATAVQYTLGASPQYGGLGEGFFKRRVGVRMTMLGEEGTTAYTAWTPVMADYRGRWMARERFAYGAEEPAGATFAAVRRKARTCFAAVHEPFEDAPRVAEVWVIQQTPSAVGVAVVGVDGSGIDDRVLIAFGDEAGKPVTLKGNGETFTFTGFAYLRQTAGKPVVQGALASHELTNPSPAPRKGRIAAFWQPETAVRAPTGGTAEATLTLRNVGFAKVTEKVRIQVPDALYCEPDRVELKNFAPGAEQTVRAKFGLQSCAPQEAANRLYTARLVGDSGAAEVQPAELKVSVGVVAKREMLGLGEWCTTIYSPRYLARYYYMESVGAAMLLDPAGMRRVPSTSQTYPMISATAKDDKGREGWSRPEKAIRFPYFVPSLVAGDANGPAYLYEGGKHAHGTTAPLEHWFCEDWIMVRKRDAEAGQSIVYDWLAGESRGDAPGLCHPGVREDLAAERAPGKLIVAGEDGKEFAGKPEDWPKGVKMAGAAGVSAVFRRPHGTAYGETMFYPAGSRLAGGAVAQPADKPMAFTYCTEEEFPALLAKWRKMPPPDVTTARAIYSGAYMPKVRK